MNLTVTDLTKTFTRADERIELFHDFDLTLNAGEALTVLGPSGSGKTTLLRLACLNRFFRPHVIAQGLPTVRVISWLQSPSGVILEPPKIKSDTVSTVSPIYFP